MAARAGGGDRLIPTRADAERAAPVVTSAPALRAAVWAFRAAGSARRQLKSRILEDLRLPHVPPVPETAQPGVLAGLRARRATCLVRAAVLQRWHAAHGSRRAVVVGVTSPSSGFAAHAWLEGDPPCPDGTYHELLRYGG